MSKFIIDTSNIKISTGVDLTSKPASATPSSKTVSVQMTDTAKLALLKKLNITLDQYNAIKAQNPNFETLPFTEQSEMVIAAKTATKPISVPEVPTEAGTSTTTPKNEHNEKDLNGKIEDCYSELAKNIYIHGASFQGKTVQSHLKLAEDEKWDKIDDGRKDELVASAEQEWNALSAEEKKAAVDKVKSFINLDEQLKEAKDNLYSKVDDSKKAFFIDKVYLDIKAAGYANISYADYIKKDEFDRLDITEQYLLTEDPENYTPTEKFYSGRIALLNKGTAIKLAEEAKAEDLKKQKEDPSYKPDESKWDPNNYPLDLKNSARYVKYHNLSQDELIYTALQEKVNSNINLNDNEKEAYTYYKKLNNKNFQGYILEAKAKNLENLQAQYNSLNERVKKGETLSEEEQVAYREIPKTLEKDKELGEESLLKRAEFLPKPESDYDKNVVKNLEAAKATGKNLNSGSDTEAVSITNSIEVNTKGMSHSEKLRYIKTVLKYNFSASSIDIARNYLKEFPELLQDINAANAMSSNVDELSDNQASVLNTTITDAGKSKDERTREIAKRAAVTGAQVLSSEENRGKSELDNKRVMATSTVEAVGTTEDINTYGINVAASITDAKKSTEAVSVLYNSDKANDETYIVGVQSASTAPTKAQAFWVTAAGQRSSKATAYTAENNIIAGLDKEAQQEAFVGTHNNINKHFEGKDAIKYSNALADQIQYCDKDNQLAMHNEMMTSKYSEVQEHVAGNIKNYDPTVQTEALSTVYKSGNEKAIEVAVNEVLPSIKSPDAQQIALKQAVMELAGISDDSEIQAKFANGTLTKAEIAQLSTGERREYYVKLFDNATPAEKIKYLKSLPNGRNRQTVYNLIGTYYKNTFKSLVESDVATAEMMFNMGLKSDLQNIVRETIIFKAETNPSFKFLRDRLHLNGAKDLADVETEPVTAKTINNFSVPFDFDTKEIFKKDKQGRILA